MNHLIVLTAPGCQPCEVLKKMLDDLGVQYEVIDVTVERIPVRSVPQLIDSHGVNVTDHWTTLYIGVPGSKEELKKIIGER